MNPPGNDKIKAVCGQCGARYQIGRERIGQRIRCAKCQAVFTLAPLEAPGVPRPEPAAIPSASPPVQAGGRPPAGQHPAGAAAAPEPPGLNQAETPPDSGPSHPQWLAAAMLEVGCPHCRGTIPLSRTFIGSYLACPRCGQRFVVGPDGTAQPPEPPLHRRLLKDPRFIRLVAGVAAAVILIAVISLVVNSRRESRLLRALAAVYPAPNYVLTPIKAPKKDRTVHKTADNSKQCRAAWVQVAHTPTGMAFNRVMCESEGRWQPTFRQTVADRVAADYIGLLDDGPSGGFDVGELPWTVFDPNARNHNELYNTAEIPEERRLARQFGPALDALTSGREAPADPPDDDGGDEDSEDYEDWGYDYESSMADYYERYYLAHAVMYPDQAEELFRDGKISEMP